MAAEKAMDTAGRAYTTIPEYKYKVVVSEGKTVRGLCSVLVLRTVAHTTMITVLDGLPAWLRCCTVKIQAAASLS